MNHQNRNGAMHLITDGVVEKNSTSISVYGTDIKFYLCFLCVEYIENIN